jgi:hypothetical protein
MAAGRIRSIEKSNDFIESPTFRLVVLTAQNRTKTSELFVSRPRFDEKIF